MAAFFRWSRKARPPCSSDEERGGFVLSGAISCGVARYYITMDKMSSIRRMYVWLCRIRHIRGFGVQSPSAYRFIRYVINEHYPYYAYNDLKDCLSILTKTELRLYKLYFRLSNHIQPSLWIDCCTKKDDIIQRFIKAGSLNTHYLYNDTLSSVSAFDVLRLDCRKLDIDGYEHLFLIASSHSLLILEGIYDDKHTKRLWRQMVDDERIGVTYDLYDCGLVFFDKTNPKQNYIVNF